MKLKWSNFVNDYHNNGNVILFQSVNRAVNMITEDTYQMIQEVLAGKKPTAEEKKIIAELYVDHIIVDENTNERNEIIQVRADRDKTGECSIYFVPTFSCNFRCPYCIVSSTEHESTCHEALPTKERVEDMAEWLENYVVSKGLKKLRIELFGGEPLVGYDQCVIFLKKLQGIKNKGVELVVNMISNCYLITEEKIDELVSLGLSHIQCTIDGPKEIHDKRRILANGKGSFDVIIENLKLLQRKKIDFLTRINIDLENAPHICELIEYLHSLGFHHCSSIGLAPVDPPITNQKITGHNEETMKYMEKIYWCLKENGFEFKMWETFCGNGVKDFFVMCPDGKLYNCPSFAGMKGYEAGDIYQGGFFKERKGIHELPEKCLDCSLVGVCAGGCYFTKMVHNLGDSYCLEVTHSNMIRSYMLAKHSEAGKQAD